MCVDGTPAEAQSPTLKISSMTSNSTCARPYRPLCLERDAIRFCCAPSYRGYDVGVAFNENYVRLMYRLAGSDLALYLFDANTVPVRNASGRLVILRSRWDVASNMENDENEEDLDDDRQRELVREARREVDPPQPAPRHRGRRARTRRGPRGEARAAGAARRLLR